MKDELAAPMEGRWGTMEVEPDTSSLAAKLQRPGEPAPAVEVCRWKPPPALAGQLPPDFTFAMTCVRWPEGRRFWPAMDVPSHLARFPRQSSSGIQ